MARARFSERFQVLASSCTKAFVTQVLNQCVYNLDFVTFCIILSHLSCTGPA